VTTDNLSLELVYNILLELKDTVVKHQKSLDENNLVVQQQIDGLGEKITTQIEGVKSFVNEEIRKVAGKLTTVEGKLQVLEDSTCNLDTRLTGAEQKLSTYEEGNVLDRLEDAETKILSLEDEEDEHFNPNVTLVATNVKYQEGENILEVAQKLVHVGLEIPDMKVVRALRLKPRHHPASGKTTTGIVKIELESQEHKVRALKKKQKLVNNVDWPNTWIRSSKSHSDRVNEINFKTLLNMIPGGESKMVSGNGRIIDKKPRD
jgi:hypothetical protein